MGNYLPAVIIAFIQSWMLSCSLFLYASSGFNRNPDPTLRFVITIYQCHYTTYTTYICSRRCQLSTLLTLDNGIFQHLTEYWINLRRATSNGGLPLTFSTLLLIHGWLLPHPWIAVTPTYRHRITIESPHVVRNLESLHHLLCYFTWTPVKNPDPIIRHTIRGGI